MKKKISPPSLSLSPGSMPLFSYVLADDFPSEAEVTWPSSPALFKPFTTPAIKIITSMPYFNIKIFCEIELKLNNNETKPLKAILRRQKGF